jgi:transmembrane 9 superfamily protein 2/4
MSPFAGGAISIQILLLLRILDNLPVAMVKMRKDERSGNLIKTYERGYPVGFRASLEGQTEIKFFLHNHLRYTILYHKDAETDLARIVGFEVEPFSVKHAYDGAWDKSSPVLDTCNPGRMTFVTHNLPPQPVADGAEIVFSYDVRFVASEVKWASRWDTYLLMMDDQIHWFSIINSVMIVLFLSGMVAMIMLRTVARDITKYNQLESADDAQEETGWKLVHGDVFRPPANSSLLASYVGSGVQIFGMALVTMVFALLGFLSPANRGGLMTAMLMMFVFMGLFAGYFSARLYKSFRGEEWKKMTIPNCPHAPRSLLCHIFCPQYAHLGGEVIGCRSLWHALCPLLPLVWHFCPPRLCGLLLWLQENCCR